MLKRVTFLHWNREQDGMRRPVSAGALWLGLIWALSATLTAFLLLALWVFVSSGRTYNLAALLAAVSLLAAVLGGLVGGNSARRLGWLHGGLVGTLYGASLVLLLAAGGSGAPGLTVLAGRLGACAVLGVVGGVAGVNLPPYSWTGRREMLRRRGM